MAGRVEEIFGRGFVYPFRATGAGRLAENEGEDRLFQAIEVILDTPRGTCPLDPEFGIGEFVYDNVTDASRIGHDIADSIERSEPRLQGNDAEIDVDILEADAATGNLTIRIAVKPIGAQVKTNRIFKVFGLVPSTS